MSEPLRIIDFDPAVPEAGDFFLMWDASANAGTGGTRRADAGAFAGMVSGQGLTANGGRLDWGGHVVGQDVDIMLDSGRYLEIYHTENYLTDLYITEYDGYGFVGLSATKNTFDADSQLILQPGDSLLRSWDSADDSSAYLGLRSQGTSTESNIELQPDLINLSTNYIQGSNRYINAYGPIIYQGNAYDNTLFDSVDESIPTAGWVRQQLGVGGDTPIYAGFNYLDNQTLRIDFNAQEASAFAPKGLDLALDLVGATDAYFNFIGAGDSAQFSVNVGTSELGIYDSGQVYTRSYNGIELKGAHPTNNNYTSLISNTSGLWLEKVSDTFNSSFSLSPNGSIDASADANFNIYAGDSIDFSVANSFYLHDADEYKTFFLDSTMLDIYIGNALNADSSRLSLYDGGLAILNSSKTTGQTRFSADGPYIEMWKFMSSAQGNPRIIGITSDNMVKFDFPTISAPAGASAYIPVKLNGANYALELKAIS